MKLLAHGEPITAEQVEAFTSSGDPRQFECLINDLIAAELVVLGAVATGSASFSGRSAKDHGIDGLVWYERPETCPATALGLTGPGKTYLQYTAPDILHRKKEDVRKELIRKAKDDLKKTFAHARGDMDGYTFVANVCLTAPESAAFRADVQAAADRLAAGNRRSIRVRAAFAGDLQVLLNQHPQLRSAYFVRDEFASAPLALEEERRRSRVPGFVGRSRHVTELRGRLLERDLRALVLFGPPGVGKTRLVLESLVASHLDGIPMSAVLFSGADPLTEGDLRRLEPEKGRAIVVADSIDPDRGRRLIDFARGLERVLLVLTSIDSLEVPSDPRVAVWRCEPMTGPEVHELIAAVAPRADWRVAVWIAEQAAGNPRLVIELAEMLSDADSTELGALPILAEAHEKRTESRIGRPAMDLVEALSLLTRVAHPDVYARDFEALSDLRRIDRVEARRRLDIVERSGVVRRSGPFLEVTPSLLASRLATRVLQAPPTETAALLDSLTLAGRLRFVERLVESAASPAADAHEILAAVAATLNRREPTDDLTWSLLSRLTNYAPDEVFERFRTFIESPAARDPRLVPSAVWAFFDRLLFTDATAERAFGVLAELVRNAADELPRHLVDRLAEMLFPRNREVGVGFDVRAKSVSRIARSGTPSGKLILLRAIREALHPGGIVTVVRTETSAVPPVRRAAARPEDWEPLVGAMISACEAMADAKSDLGSEAARLLPFVALGAFNSTGNRRVSLDAFERLATRFRSLDGPVRKAFREDFGRLRTQLRQSSGGRDNLPNEIDDQLQRIEALTRPANPIDRLRTLVGNENSWEISNVTSVDRDSLEERDRKEIESIAEELVRDDAVETLPEWLFSRTESPRSPVFFVALGRLDRARKFRPQIRRDSRVDQGSDALGQYCAGWATRGISAVEDFLDLLVSDADVPGIDTVVATSCLPASERAVSRISMLIENRKDVDTERASRILASRRWLDGLSAERLSALLIPFRTEGDSNPRARLEILAHYLRLKGSLSLGLTTLATGLLSGSPVLAGTSNWTAWSELAEYLARHDSDTGFSILRSTLDATPKIEPYAETKNLDALWSMLRDRDPVRAWKILLDWARGYERRGGRIVGFRVARWVRDKRDVEAVAQWAKETPDDRGRTALLTVNAESEFFWDFARLLIPVIDDLEFRTELHELAASIAHRGDASDAWERQAAAADSVANDPCAAPPAREWARRLARDLRAGARRGVLWDTEFGWAELRAILRGPDSERRRWALKRLLEHARPSDVTELVTLRDIESVMDDLESPRREEYRRLLALWKANGQ